MYYFKGTMVDQEDGNPPSTIDGRFATEDKNVAIIAAICTMHYGWNNSKAGSLEPDLGVINEWLEYYNVPELSNSSAEMQFYLDEEAVYADYPKWSPHYSCEDATMVYREKVKGAKQINLCPKLAKEMIDTVRKKQNDPTLAKENLGEEPPSCDIEIF